MDFTHSAPSILKTKEDVPYPSVQALRTLFVASAIPMVGFGFMGESVRNECVSNRMVPTVVAQLTPALPSIPTMPCFTDNLVMIQAGQYIDSTLGVTLGLATMSAAAAGQVVSDVSGVVFGGTLERFLTQLSVIKTPPLSSAQRQLSVCRNVSMAGAVVGVVCGCALGATTLLLVDLEARNRIERANQLREIVTDMISQDEDGLHSETCTIYIASSSDFHLDKDNDKKWRTSMKLLKDAETPAVKECATKREIVLDQNRHVLFTPIMDDDHVIAVIEFRHNRNDSSCFSEQDVRTAKVMARHIAIFMNRSVE